jgi:tRNA threonylcarbamoyladenosine biosynthesis protein TsaE
VGCQWQLRTAADTAQLGAALAHSCPWEQDGPRLLYLSGELGAGKTTLAAALLAALEVGEAVRSPSYALIETYAVKAGLVLHLDCYRLNEPDELEQLGLRDYFNGGTLWLVEWPEHAAGALPVPDLTVQLQYAADGRSALIEARSDTGRGWLRLVSPRMPSQI